MATVPVAALPRAPGRRTSSEFPTLKKLARRDRRAPGGEARARGARRRGAAQARDARRNRSRESLRRNAVCQAITLLRQGRLDHRRRLRASGLPRGLELARAGAHVVLSGRSAETLKKAQKEARKRETVVARRRGPASRSRPRRRNPQAPRPHRHPGEQRRHQPAAAQLPATSRSRAGTRSSRINLSGTFYPCHAVLPAMREQQAGPDHQHRVVGRALRQRRSAGRATTPPSAR